MKKIINTFLKQKKQKQKGFTLLELLVVVALLSILMSVSLFNYANFGRDVELENATYTTALAIREVQVFGINRAVRKGTETNVKNTFSPNKYRYGFYVEKDAEKLILFRDRGSDYETATAGHSGVYNSEGRSCANQLNPECYSEVLLTRGNSITNIELLDSEGNTVGSNSDVNISFLRPDPDAVILNSNMSVDQRVSRVNITISDQTKNFSRCVSVGYAGDISIKKSC